jgi:hypothetical protein
MQRDVLHARLGSWRTGLITRILLNGDGLADEIAMAVRRANAIAELARTR